MKIIFDKSISELGIKNIVIGIARNVDPNAELSASFLEKQNKMQEWALQCDINEIIHNSTIQGYMDLLQKVGLNPKHYMNRLPKELSGGEKQRVGILRAIIANPKILLMDEPFSALDPLSKVQLQDLIKTLHNEYKMTTVFVTHDMDEAMKLADRICVLKEGKVVQIATPEVLKENPADDFVREFFARGNK